MSNEARRSDKMQETSTLNQRLVETYTSKKEEDSFDSSNNALFLSRRCNSFWTDVDQQLRLFSLNQLYARSLEFQSYPYTFRATGRYDYTTILPKCVSSDVVAYIYTLGTRTQDATIVPRCLVYSDIDNLQQYLKSDAYIWINVCDPRVLQQIGDLLSLHNLATASFFDLRCQSKLMSVDNAIFQAVCFPVLDADKTRIFKLYAYCQCKLLITFERELFTDNTIAASSSLSCSSIISTMLHRISAARINNHIQRFGLTYLLYELCVETHTLSSGVIEYISRTIIFLKEQVHKELSYAEKVVTHRNICVVISVITMFKHLNEATRDDFKKITDKTTTEFDMLYMLTNDQMPFMTAMLDSYQFFATCLQRQYNDVQTIRASLTHVHTIRSEKTSVNLALVATLFLPLTFLAGVFGMNFQRHGGYTMSLLNSSHGPLAFWLMCVGVLIINLILFTRSGYISWRSKESHYLHEMTL